MPVQLKAMLQSLATWLSDGVSVEHVISIKLKTIMCADVDCPPPGMGDLSLLWISILFRPFCFFAP